MKGMNACALPFGFRVLDHCACVVDMQAASWEGKTQPIRQPKAHLLNTKTPGLLEGYMEALEGFIAEHRLKKLNHEDNTTGTFQRRLDNIEK
jgi:hypothetical protein